MNRIRIGSSLGLLLVGSLIAAQEPRPPQPPPVPPAHVIPITAQKYKYTPNEIHVRKGEHVRLVLMALDRTHGFKIDGLGIERKIEKGKETVVEFDAAAEGEIPFHCSLFCGFGHKHMKGKIVVEPAAVAPAPPPRD